MVIEVEFATRFWTIGELILWQKLIAGNFEAFANLVASRSNLTLEQVLSMDCKDIPLLMEKFQASVKNQEALQKMSESLSQREQE